MSKRDYYEILGVAKSANEGDIKKAYRSLASKHHPDKGGDTAKFQEIQEAYAVLSDSQKRESYDQYGHSAPTHSGSHQWTHNAQQIDPDMFKEMFGNMFGGNSPFGDIFGNTHHARTKPRHVINISLEDAYCGKQLKIPGGVSINIHAGIRSGSKFYSDDAIYEIQIPPHPKFKRSGDDLLVDVELTAIEAMLSVEATLDHLDSSQLQFTIPAGIQNGQIVRLASKGMKNPETDKNGDLMVRITVTTPRSLTDEQKAFLKTMQHRESFKI